MRWNQWKIGAFVLLLLIGMAGSVMPRLKEKRLVRCLFQAK